MIDMEAIKARHEAATPGPWDWEADDPQSLSLGTKDHIQEQFVLSAWRCPTCADRDAQCLWPSHANADFIAHARDDIPAMLAEVDKLNDLARENYCKFVRQQERAEKAETALSAERARADAAVEIPASVEAAADYMFQALCMAPQFTRELMNAVSEFWKEWAQWRGQKGEA